jgi:hypothetical protein
MEWTQSICYDCWDKREPNRIPVRIRFSDDEFPDYVEICCDCGRKTIDGIFIKDDPNKVNFPLEESKT